MRVLIIEDEQVAATRLMHLLQDYDPAIEIAAHLYSVEEALQWLQQETPPDVVFSDIHLSDGFCFDIFFVQLSFIFFIVLSLSNIILA